MFDELILPEEAVLESSGDAPSAVLPIRLPWYRSLPLSTIEGYDLTVDGAKISPDNVTINVGGQHYSLAEAAQLPDAWWFVLDTLQTQVKVPAGAGLGDHQLELVLTLRIPYASPDRGQIFPHFIQTAVNSRTVTFTGKDD